MSLLEYLECSYCGKQYDPEELHNLCPGCQKPLLARYDIHHAPADFTPQKLKNRQTTLWRYEEMLPIRDNRYRLSLGEGFTPLIQAQRLGEILGLTNLYLKEEGLNPTTSFKARGLSVALSRAYELGVDEVFIPSAGNAAGALSAYAARAGIKAFVYMPEDVPKTFVAECQALGAQVHLVHGLITDCGKTAREQAAGTQRFDLSTLKEPYRLEGKKTMGYEIAEQMNWILPDAIIYPTGGGTGLIGMWKAFEEMEQLGWIQGKKPRMVCVQSCGCAPMVRAYEHGAEFAETWKDAKTVADGLRVPSAVGDFLILRTIRESNGIAIAVSDDEMMSAAQLTGETEGVYMAPEGGATCAALKKLLECGWIQREENVILFNTGSGHKYYHLWSEHPLHKD